MGEITIPLLTETVTALLIHRLFASVRNSLQTLSQIVS